MQDSGMVATCSRTAGRGGGGDFWTSCPAQPTPSDRVRHDLQDLQCVELMCYVVRVCGGERG